MNAQGICTNNVTTGSNIAIQRPTQRTQRFIRWVRVWIYKEARWSAAIARPGKVWAGNYS